jgi:hypothetical protein
MKVKLRNIASKMKISRSQLTLKRMVPAGMALVMAISAWLVWPASAAISLRSVSVANNGGGSTSITFSPPAGVAAGDVLIAVLGTRAGDALMSVQTGWTLINNGSWGSPLMDSYVFYRVATASESSYTFTSSSSSKMAVVAMAYSGVDTINPVDAQNNQVNSTASTTMTAPSITTTQLNTKLIAAYTSASSGTVTAGSGMTLQGQTTSSGGGQAGSKVTVGAQDITQAAAGATGTKTATGPSAASIGHLIALRPAPAISQASFRFFQNTDSTTASTPLAAKDTAAPIEKDVPFRVRLNLGIGSTGSNMTAVTARTFKLQYALKSGTCGAYADVTTGTVVRFYNNATPADGTAYVADATNDPSRSGVTAIGQKYHEANPLSAATTTPAGQDALWDVALTTSGATFGQTYCLRAVYGADSSALNGGYTVTPEFTIATPTISQANYRLYANADSATPGSPLAAQDTAATIVTSTPFRLRQRLAVGAAQLPASNQNYKMQYAEKSGTCDTGFSGETYSDINSGSGPSAAYAGTAVNDASYGTVAWTNPTNAVGTTDAISAAVASPASNGTNISQYLKLTNFGFSIPTGATVTGVQVTLNITSDASAGGLTGRQSGMIVKAGATAGTDKGSQTWDQTNSTNVMGSSSDLWGTTLTPTDINSTGFGVAVSVYASYDNFGSLQLSTGIDSAQITVYYTVPSGVMSYYNNATPADLTAISSSGSDPTNASRPTVYQTYRETDPFTNSIAAIPSGSDGLWDFSLTPGSAAAGKIYCFRVVKSDGSLLDSYSQIPEISVGSGGGSGPTLDQQLRGGAGVVNGTKSGLVW